MAENGTDNTERGEIVRVKARAVDPITTQVELDELKEYMRHSSISSDLCYRNYMLVVIGVNFGLRASDLCKLKLSDLRDKEHLDIIERKTKKRRIIYINESVRGVINDYINDVFIFDESSVYLFPSRKGGHIQPKYIHRLIKGASRALGWMGNYGSHSLRKTMAYHVLERASGQDDEAVKKIMYMFNHSNERVTKRYLTSSKVADMAYATLNL